MPFYDFNTKQTINIWTGINGAFYHSDQLTFGHVTLDKGAIVGDHAHPHEQWTHVLEGEIEFTIAGETNILTKGMAAFIPSNAIHSAKALTACKVLDCFLPTREDFIDKETNSL